MPGLVRRPRLTGSPVEALVELTDAVPQGERYIACCPAHDDASPSLSIAEGEDGRVLLFCHAGCTAQAVLKAIGWEMRDLYPRGRRASSPVKRTEPKVPTILAWGRQAQLHADAKRLMASPAPLAQLDREKGISADVAERHHLGLDVSGRIVLPLNDEHGQPISVERMTLPGDRWEGQRDKVRADPGSPRWIWTPDRELPESVIVAESAWDALAAESSGHTAVGAPGASIWRDSWAAQLQRQGVRECGVCFDCDDAGREGGRKVVSSLRAAGIDAWAVDLDPEADDGRDLTDYLLAEREGALTA